MTTTDQSVLTPPDKVAASDHPIRELLRVRWSPRAFSERDVSLADLKTILEAARWAASSANVQPWHFIVARRAEPEAFRRMLSCLTERNQAWAKNAAVLMVSVARLDRAPGKPNPHAYYDVGQAAANMAIQATALGISMHQMAGIEVEAVREVYRVPEGFDPVTGIALGYRGSLDVLPDYRQVQEVARRERRPQNEYVFVGGGESPPDW